MRLWRNPFRHQDLIHEQLVSDNREATKEYNEKMLTTLTLMGGLLMLLPLSAEPFSGTRTSAIPAYVLAASIFFAMYFLHKLPNVKKYTLCGLYIGYSIFFLFTIYLSVIFSPGTRATILLGSFCIMPMSFIDRPGRMNLFVTLWLAVHTILASFLKPQYWFDDMINCLCFTILGCYLGNKMVRVRLESFQAQRLLTIEKETDVLTGLFNRRKLFETLAVLETADAEKPSGILMVDIDHFKNFNDSYGHAAGDSCLSRFGKVLTEFTQDFRLRFYRYGGEEFVAMAYGYDEKDLFAIAESVRSAVQSADMDGRQITVSIGVAYCGNERVLNYDKVIDRADKAVYAAKRIGRNSVCLEQKELHA